MNLLSLGTPRGPYFCHSHFQSSLSAITEGTCLKTTTNQRNLANKTQEGGFWGLQRQVGGQRHHQRRPYRYLSSFSGCYPGLVFWTQQYPALPYLLSLPKPGSDSFRGWFSYKPKGKQKEEKQICF